MNAIVDTNQGAMLLVRAVPNASRSEVAQIGPDCVRIRLQAPPVEGKANKALVAYLAETLGIRTRQVTIIGGEQSRQKRVLVSDLSAAEVTRRLSAE